MVPELASKYRAVGAEMAARRSPDKKWEDGSNWHDGRSHEPPLLPLPPDTEILECMTCTQWEALEMSVFPESDDYDGMNWHRQPDADRIGDQWNANLVDTIWGDLPEADEWMEGENFIDSCGSLMR